jgi:hypothetical protein
VLCVTESTFSAKEVYTFDLYILLEKLKCEIPRSVFLQNPDMILSWILDMLWRLACVGHVRAPPLCLGPPCKVLNQSIIGFSPLSETT